MNTPEKKSRNESPIGYNADMFNEFILSRLPLDCVLGLKLVSKSWSKLVKDSGYINEESGYVGIVKDGEDSVYQLLYLEYDGEDSVTRKFLRTRFPVEPYIVGSRNGILCIAIPYCAGIPDPIFIINPVTKESLELPRVRDGEDITGGSIQFCFAYHDGFYKIVRIFWQIEGLGLGQVQLFVLGGESSWIDIGQIGYNFDKRGIYSEDYMYWISYDAGKVVSLNLVTHEFYEVSKPPFKICAPVTQLLELNEKVCLLRERNRRKEEDDEDDDDYDEEEEEKLEDDISVWTLENDDDWVKLFKFSLTYDESVPRDLFPFVVMGEHEIFALEENRRVLCWQERDILLCYDTVDDEDRVLLDEDDENYQYHNYVPHRLTLKALPRPSPLPEALPALPRHCPLLKALHHLPCHDGNEEDEKPLQRENQACEEIKSKVDSLAVKVSLLEASVLNKDKVIDKEFVDLEKILMEQQLELDGISFEGEARVDIDLQVSRVQNLVDTVVDLKAKYGNPISNDKAL